MYFSSQNIHQSPWTKGSEDDRLQDFNIWSHDPVVMHKLDEFRAGRLQVTADVATLIETKFNDSCFGFVWSKFDVNNIVKYKVEISNQKVPSMVPIKAEIGGQDFEFSQCHLNESTPYKVRLTAVGQKPGKVETVTGIMWTTHKVPPPPPPPKIIFVTQTTITISIPEVTLYNGPLSAVEIRLRSGNHPQADDMKHSSFLVRIFRRHKRDLEIWKPPRISVNTAEVPTPMVQLANKQIHMQDGSRSHHYLAGNINSRSLTDWEKTEYIKVWSMVEAKRVQDRPKSGDWVQEVSHGDEGNDRSRDKDEMHGDEKRNKDKIHGDGSNDKDKIHDERRDKDKIYDKSFAKDKIHGDESNDNTIEGVVNITENEDNITGGVGNITEGVVNITEGVIIITEVVGNITKGVGNISAEVSNITEGMVNITEGVVNITEGVVNITEDVVNIAGGVIKLPFDMFTPRNVRKHQSNDPFSLQVAPESYHHYLTKTERLVSLIKKTGPKPRLNPDLAADPPSTYNLTFTSQINRDLFILVSQGKNLGSLKLLMEKIQSLFDPKSFPGNSNLDKVSLFSGTPEEEDSSRLKIPCHNCPSVGTLGEVLAVIPAIRSTNRKFSLETLNKSEKIMQEVVRQQTSFIRRKRRSPGTSKPHVWSGPRPQKIKESGDGLEVDACQTRQLLVSDIGQFTQVKTGYGFFIMDHYGVRHPYFNNSKLERSLRRLAHYQEARDFILHGRSLLNLTRPDGFNVSQLFYRLNNVIDVNRKRRNKLFLDMFEDFLFLNKDKDIKQLGGDEVPPDAKLGLPPGVPVGHVTSNLALNFTIGDGKGHDGIPNPQLKPGMEYEVVVVLMSTVADVTKHSWSSVNVTTLPAPPEIVPSQIKFMIWSFLALCACIFSLVLCMLWCSKQMRVVNMDDCNYNMDRVLVDTERPPRKCCIQNQHTACKSHYHLL